MIIDKPPSGQRYPLPAVLGAVTFLAVSLLGACASPKAQTFDVPEPFTVEHDFASEAGDDLRPIVQVQPEDGAFSHLSRLALYQVEAEIGDPEAWLKDRVALNLVQPEADPEGWFESPDSPFADPSFDFLRDIVPEFLEGMRSLGRLPLEACDDPTRDDNAVGSYYELDCEWSVGPLAQYSQFRLQQVDGDWYLIEIEAMNERRFRHLIAIANSFHL